MSRANLRGRARSREFVEFRGERLGPAEQARIRRYVASHSRAPRDQFTRGVCELFGCLRPNGEPPVLSRKQLA